MTYRSNQWLDEAKKVSRVLSKANGIDRFIRIDPAEFKSRQKKVIEELSKAHIDAASIY